MRRLLPLLLLPLLACGPIHKPLPTELPEPQVAWHQAVDWEDAGVEAAQVLSGYLQVDTRNPPGNETLGAEHLARLLAAEGIESRIVEHAPGRGSLLARLEGSGQEAPICLLSHIDVVPWEDDGWPTHHPLSGDIDEDGVIWGRGALDMKGMGAVELMTMIWIKRLDIPLKRDVILLAVSDEEVGNHGARYIADNHWGEIGCSHMVNEGGLGVRDALFEGQTVFAISTFEKGVLWLKMIASGAPGHGSTPRPDEAPARLIEAIARLDERDVPTHYHPATVELFYRIGMGRSGLEQTVLTRPKAVKALLEKRLLGVPATAAMMTNTVHLTGMDGFNEPNVVPAEVAAILDCRIQPDVDPREILAELEALYADMPWIRFEVLHEMVGNGSPWDDPFYAALAHHLVDGREDAVAGPIVSVGFTDSIIFRPLGVRAYGIAPFEVNEAEASTMHGNDERLSVASVRGGLKALFSAVVDVSAAPGGTPPATPMKVPVRRSPELEPESEPDGVEGQTGGAPEAEPSIGAEEPAAP
jgi:acetylornithine deacetylase/succinyl-diaminopimelate desuccinylase-like protein